MSDDWDTGADKTEAAQDSANQFDPMRAMGGPPKGSQVAAQPQLRVYAAPKQDTPEIARKLSSQVPDDQVPNTPPPVKAAAKAAPKAAVQAKGNDQQRFSARVEGGKIKPSAGASSAFTQKLDEESLAFFNKIADSPFSEQAAAFLNAYWPEVGSQAEFIFTVAYETIKYADMHAKGVQYIHLYDEGNDLDFNIGLYFYEKLCKFVLDSKEGKQWRDDPKYAMSMPEMQTAIVRKQEIREKVDVNFDGRISFLEYLLYQYQEFANPADFTVRSMKVQEATGDNPALLAAKKALEEVNAAIRAYEAERMRLEKEAAGSGVKALGATHQLAALSASPLMETLNTALIKAEAAVRMVSRQGKRSGSVFVKDPAERPAKPTDGSVWWLNREIAAKKARYGR